MTIKELRIELIKRNKTISWLATKLGYSTAYVYKVIDMQKQNEVERIKKILSEVIEVE